MYRFAPNIIILRPEVLLLFIILSNTVNKYLSRETQKPVNWTEVLVKMPVLSQDEKGQVIGHLESVKSISEVAKMFGCTRATIHSLKQKFAATGTLKRKKGSGRKISTTEIQENAIITAHELNHFMAAAKKYRAGSK